MRRRRSSAGLSLIELMLALAIGLLIVAAASGLLVVQLREYRSMTLQTRLTQEMRSALELIQRDLRRAGYWGHAGAAGANPYAALDLTGSGDASALALRYSLDATENDTLDPNEQFGVRLRSGAIELQLGTGNWQALTDSATLSVTALRIRPTVQDLPLAAFCSSPCAPGAHCAPNQQQRTFTVEIVARLVADPSFTRSLQGSARVRGDAISGSCGGA